jgi:hypothetical protein
LFTCSADNANQNSKLNSLSVLYLSGVLLKTVVSFTSCLLTIEFSLFLELDIFRGSEFVAVIEMVVIGYGCLPFYVLFVLSGFRLIEAMAFLLMQHSSLTSREPVVSTSPQRLSRYASY